MQHSGVCVCHSLLVGLAACSVVVCVCVSRRVGGTGSMQRSGVCVCGELSKLAYSSTRAFTGGCGGLGLPITGAVHPQQTAI